MALETLNLSFRSPWQVLSRWPDSQPLIFLGGAGGQSALALDVHEVDFELAASTTISSGHHPDSGPSFVPGYIALLSYDHFAQGATHSHPNRAWSVGSFLVWDADLQSVVVTGEPSAEARALVADIWQYDSLESGECTPSPWQWLAAQDGQSYLAQAEQVIEDIRNGRYYELNLLRYFKLTGSPTRQQIVDRLQAVAGAFGGWLRVKDLDLISFSPERFVRMTQEDGAAVMRAFPIKGTAARFMCKEQDAASKRQLLSSSKEQAELNMITDLMRHDLQKVCLPNSVQVPNPGTVQKLPHVYHRQSEISGVMKPGIKIADCLRALCPAGSITGAPKKEVMTAIQELEKRHRGYFMGNIAYWSKNGDYMDSSVLIRTMVSTDLNTYEFAAGSGIVLGSDPSRELEEIGHKCRVVMSTCP